MHQNIKEHMEVVGSDGALIGTVDRVQGSEIKLTKRSDESGSTTSSRSTGSTTSTPRSICPRRERRQGAVARSGLSLRMPKRIAREARPFGRASRCSAVRDARCAEHVARNVRA